MLFRSTLIAEAMLDIYHRGSKRYAKEALDWILSDETKYVFSFLSLCDQFDINASTMQADVLDDIHDGRAKSRIKVMDGFDRTPC